MQTRDAEVLKKSDELYDRCGKPLEGEHWGEYVAIFPDGNVVLGPDLYDVTERASEQFGAGSFVFKIGPKIVWKFR